MGFIICIMFLSSILIIGCAGKNDAIETRPNIILIMTDDQGWYDAGFNGNPHIKTPNLDALSGEGVVFDRFYSASAVCSPTRASVITGRNPLRMGIPTANSGHMKEQEITIAEILKSEGYRTGHFGKWHLGTLTTKERDSNRGGLERFASEYSIPSIHGYETFFCTEAKVPTYDPLTYPVEFREGESKKYGWAARERDEAVVAYGTAYWKGEDQKADSNLEGDDARVILDRVIPFISQSVSERSPFFLTLWIHAPHLPVVADSFYRSLYRDLSLKEQIYFGCISALDAQVGRLWNVLVEMGIEENTMVWYCSDNGPERNTPGSTGKFRERKRSLYEGGLRTPAFLIWKAQVEGNRRVAFPAVTSDYLPTILDVLNLEYPDDRPLDGESLLPLIQDPDRDRKSPIGFIYRDQHSWVNNRYKLYSPDKGARYELYDLIADPGEGLDIIDSAPEVAERMQMELTEWLRSVNNSSDGKDY